MNNSNDISNNNDSNNINRSYKIVITEFEKMSRLWIIRINMVSWNMYVYH